jgi:tRNA pseudouridine32 synthase / 23S rRNA pseudouridine746 synthase
MRTYKTLVSKFSSEKTSLGKVLQILTRFDEKVLHEAAAKGAVWLQMGKGKILREYNLNKTVLPQDTITFFYDPRVLSLPTLEEANCLYENQHYGIWFKEAGILPQGTQAGDHASLLRLIEKKKKAQVFLVHRLDRETTGLILFAYTSEAAAKLSKLFTENKIQKTYQAVVRGSLLPGKKGTIDVSLDDKKAITHYLVLDSSEDYSLLEIQLETGRLHQIRRHLDHIGHPVMGDPKYGKNNKNKKGLQLLAKSLGFHDPWSRQAVLWTADKRLSL